MTMLATRDEVVERLRISRRTFDVHVAPHLAAIRIGRRVLYRWDEVERWLRTQEAGPYCETSEPGSTRSALRHLKGNEPIDPRVRETVRRLREKQRKSTRRLYPVEGGRAS